MTSKSSYIFYKKNIYIQNVPIVKVHRVFSSNHIKNTASSQQFQFNGNNIGDSGKVIKPFMQVKTYLTKNFATFGLL